MSLVTSVIGVPPWLLRGALRAALWHGLFVAAVTMVKSASNAVFLARADPAGLPLLYVVVAGLVALTTGVVSRLLRQRSTRVVMRGTVLAGSAIVALVVALSALALPFAPAALYVVGEAWATTLSVLFWTRLGEAFTAREQKRVVGLVGAGGMAGAVVGGLLISVLVERAGTLAPALLAGLAPFCGLPLLGALRSRAARRSQADGAPSKQRSGARYLLTGRYPLGVAALVVLLAAMGAATDFAFRLASAATLSEVQMASLFGLLNAVVGAFVVVVQLGVTARLLARFGIFAYLALVPAGLVLLFLAMLVGAPHFAVVVVMKGLEMAGAFSLNQAAVSLLYNPMPSSIRGEVRALIDGAVKKGGAALAGLALVGLAWIDRRLVGPPLIAALAVLGLALLPWLRHQYLRALDLRLGKRRRSRPFGYGIDASDKVTRGLLLSALERDDAVVVLAALDALGTAPLPAPRLLALLHHEDERVRRAALARVPHEGEAAEADELVATLKEMVRNEVARRPRGDAVRALARVRPSALEELLEALLEDHEPGVVCAAIEASWSTPQRARVEERLEELCVGLRDRPPAWRREVARLIGTTGEGRYDAVLSGLLDDPDPSVRALAAQAAGREKHISHVPRLLAALGRREDRAAARDALIAYGDIAVPMLSRALDDRSLPLMQRIHVPRVLSSIGTASAARALLFSNPRDDAYLQRRIADRLVELCAKNPSIKVDKKRCDDAARRRLNAARERARALDDLEGLHDDERARLLVRVVRERREMGLRIALQLIGIHRGMDRVTAALRALAPAPGQAASLRHDAIELLDVHLAGDPLRPALLAALEHRPRPGTREQGLARVVRLTSSRDPLVRGIARRTAERLDIPLPSVTPGPRETHEEQLEEGEDMADDLLERLFFLEHVDLFAGLPTDDLVAIASLAEELSVPPGGVVYEENDDSDCMYVIIDGELALTRGGTEVLRLHTGESVGQTSFLDRGPRPVTARVPDGGRPARLLVIDRGAFMDLLTDRPGLMHAFFGVLGQRLRRLIARGPHDAL